MNKARLIINLDPGLLADARAVARESGLDVGEWLTRVMQDAVLTAEKHALRQVARERRHRDWCSK